MMRVLGDWFRRLRAIFLRARLDRDLDDELQMHLAMEARKYASTGIPAEEANRRARIAFGGRSQIAEACREARGLRFAENVVRDTRYALRSFRRSPGFALAVVVILAVAMGANLVLFNFCRAVLLDELPVPQPGELFLATIRYPGQPEIEHFSYPDLQQIQKACAPAQLTGFTDLYEVHVRDEGGTTSTLHGQLVTGDFFATLGVKALLGRGIDAHDNRIGAEYAAAISYRLWSGKYGRDPKIIGRELLIQNVPVRVVGIMQRGFDGLEPGQVTDVWMPLSVQPRIGFQAYASMNGGVHIEQPWMSQDVSWLHLLARSASDPGGKHLAAGLNRYLKSEVAAALKNVSVQSEREAMLQARFDVRGAAQGMPALRKRFSLSLEVLALIAAALLLSGCLNIVSLLLARARAREHEAAVRLSLGSGRSRIVAQATTEILLLCAMGAIAALVLAWWVSALIEHWLLVDQAIRIDAGVNGWSFAVASLLAVAASLLIAIVPSLSVRDLSLTRILGSRIAGVGRRSSRVSWFFVAAQLSFALVSLTITGLLARTLLNYESLNIGLDRAHTLSVALDPAAAGYSGARLQVLYGELAESVDKIPGVISSSVAGCGLMNGGCAYLPVTVSGGGEKASMAERNYVGADYFSTTGMRILRGRGITAADRAGSQAVAVVNRSFEKVFLRGGNALGHTAIVDGKQAVIIGVVADARTDGIADIASPFIYLPITQVGAWDISHLEVRTQGDPNQVVSAVRSAVLEVDRAIPIAEVVSLRDETDRGLSQQLLLGRMAGLFSLLSVLIAGIGLYGLISYEVAQRRGEFAIRMAVGATREAILQHVFARSSRLLLLGCIAGLLGSFALSRTLRSLLFEVSNYDPRTYAGSLLILLLISAAAVFAPAWRAASGDPASALRSE